MATDPGRGTALKSAILEAMDDLAASMDAFNARLNEFSAAIDNLSERVADVDVRLAGYMEESRGTAQNLISTLEDIHTHTEGCNESLESVTNQMPDLWEIADDIRRRERQEQLLDSRAAMGKVAFVRMK